MEMEMYLVSQLPFMLPLALMYAVGIILALVFFNRLGGPAVLTLAGCIILLLMTLAGPVAQGYLLALARGGEIPKATITGSLTAIGVARLLINILGFSLILAAVFMRRRAPRDEQSV